MKKNVPLLITVGIVLVILTLLFLNFGHARQEQEKVLAQWTGHDEVSRGIRSEAEHWVVANKRQQLGFLATGAVLVLVTAGWLAVHRERKRE